MKVTYLQLLFIRRFFCEEFSPYSQYRLILETDNPSYFYPVSINNIISIFKS